MLDGIRAFVATAVIIAVILLGMWNVIDAAAATGILGAVVGAFGSQAAAAQATRAAARLDSHAEPPPPPAATNGAPPP